MQPPWHLYLMAVLYIFAGLFHFLSPKPYLKIMPPYFPKPLLLVYLSGIAEILLGIGLLFQATRDWSVYGIILMLLSFIPVHINMLQNKKASLNLPSWVLILRIPLQFGLILWAYHYLNI